MKSADVRGMFMGYLASRDDLRFFADLGFSGFSDWRTHVSVTVGVNGNSVKNWRDEFDGLNVNPNRPRKGWRRKPTPSRVYMKMQLDSWSYAPLLGLAKSILGLSDEFSPESVDALFAWAIKGEDSDTKAIVAAIASGVISFSESQEIHAIEGGRKLVMHLKLERDPAVSREAVRRHLRDIGQVCSLCGLDFRRKYNLDHGEHCLEAHHKSPLSLRLAPNRTNVKDFLVICPSCHRVVHKARAFDDDSLGRLVRSSA